MSLPESSKNEGTAFENRGGSEGHNLHEDETDDFFTDEPDDYIDSTNILPDSESREQLNHFFDETTSTTPAKNAELLQQDNSRRNGEPETFGETQVGKFFKNLFGKGQ